MKACKYQLMPILLLFLFSMSIARAHPDITITVWGDGKPVPNAIVFGRFFAPDYSVCAKNSIRKIGITNSEGRLVLKYNSTDPSYRMYWDMVNACMCTENDYKGGCFGQVNVSGKTDIIIKISAPGYKPYSQTNSYQATTSEGQFDWPDISIDVLLERVD